MPEYLKTPEQLAKFGIETTGKIMDNGEKRARMRAFGVTTHVTVGLVGKNVGWQDAHCHYGLDEVYVVAEGEIAIARVSGYGFEVTNHRAGGDAVIHIEQGQDHNIYVYEGATFFTNVYGNPVGNPARGDNDWYPASEEFDKWVLSLYMEQFPDDEL